MYYMTKCRDLTEVIEIWVKDRSKINDKMVHENQEKRRIVQSWEDDRA